jgi:hypothetical protein
MRSHWSDGCQWALKILGQGAVGDGSSKVCTNKMSSQEVFLGEGIYEYQVSGDSMTSHAGCTPTVTVDTAVKQNRSLCEEFPDEQIEERNRSKERGSEMHDEQAGKHGRHESCRKSNGA